MQQAKLLQNMSDERKKYNLDDVTINAKSADVVISMSDTSKLLDLMEFLKRGKATAFQILLSICGVDFLHRAKRFEVIYNLLSVSLNQRIMIKLKVKEGDIVPSVGKIYSSAIWYEREAWDMYGIAFDSKESMERILTDYNFDGHPLRKDFPLSGHFEVFFNQETQKIERRPVNLLQDYRDFDCISPWRGA